MWRSSMAEKECRVGAAERVACADDAVKAAIVEALEGHVLPHRRALRADGPRGPARAHRLDRYRELDQPAASERVPEASLPADERRPGKGARGGPNLHPSGLERPRAV